MHLFLTWLYLYSNHNELKQVLEKKTEKKEEAGMPKTVNTAV